MQPAVPDPKAPEGAEPLAARARRDALAAAPAAFRHALRLRMVSARMVELQREGRVAFHAAVVGEELAVVATALAAREADWVFPGTREWGVAIVRGLPLATYFQHAFGTALDPAKGHSAPDHAPARAHRVAPASGVVGAHLPQAVGFAWAAKSRREEVATLAIFGDGATSTGDFHNAVNFAGVFRAPAVLVCRNNGRAGAAATTRPMKAGSVAEKAVAYGVASARVSGEDPIEILAVVREALLRAAEGKGATLVEIVTHPPESLEGVDLFSLPGTDALASLRRALEESGRLDAAAVAVMRGEIAAEIDAAVAAAEKGAPPPPETLFDDVYAHVPAHLAAQRALASAHPAPRKE